jgi:predicted transcriptional regulator
MQKRILSCEATDSLKEKLRVAAFKKSLSVSAFIREALESYLQEQETADNEYNIEKQ